MNIEIAHLYSHDQWGEDQEESLKIYKELKTEAKIHILVDDYHVDTENDISWLDQFLTDHQIKAQVSFESEMIKLSSLINLSLKETNKGSFYKNYRIKKNNDQYTCLYLTCLWFLKQTGFFNKSPETFLVILPKKYQRNENQALSLMKEISPEYSSKVLHLFY